MDFKIWTPLSYLGQPFLQQCRLAYVFGRNGRDALCITAEEDLVACGINESGCLGVGTDFTPLKLMGDSTSCKINVKGLSSGFDAKGTFIVAYTYTGQVYAWGKPIGHSPQAVSGSGTNNNFGAGPNKNFGAGPNSIFGAVPNVNFGAGVTLPFSAPISISTSPFVSNSSGSAKQPSPIISKPTQPPPIISKPTLVSFPSATEISEVACGTSHCLALSKDGKVYSWGSNNFGQLGNNSQVNSVNPILIQGNLKDKRVVKISCGDNFSVVALDNEQVYAWGDNSYGQVGFDSLSHTPYFLSPNKIRGLNDIYIKELICGKAHILLLTNVGVVYGWGKNTRGELGLGDNVSRFVPEPVQTEEKFFEIAAMSHCSISAAMSDKFQVFMWGDFPEFTFTYHTPKQMKHYKSLQEVFANFSSPRIMYKPMVRQLPSKSTVSTPEKNFQDMATSDLTITVEGKQIYVHREILSSRSNYFETLLKEHWTQKNQKVLDMDRSYDVIHSYLQYIYTGKIEANQNLALELLNLAEEYQDLTFKNFCDEYFNFNVEIDNVASLFDFAVKVNATKLLESCMQFAGNHISEILSNPVVLEWNINTKQEFLMQCKKRNLFRS
ncbi:hypothetical protein V9T40_011327 [Parthenolecanium corni]|uniref:BTB domain-containing protein n=1 Tax=Parthenolecanium corni TaxID=536013 RepID=A0AAN9XY18_9HEMI